MWEKRLAKDRLTHLYKINEMGVKETCVLEFKSQASNSRAESGTPDAHKSLCEVYIWGKSLPLQVVWQICLYCRATKKAATLEIGSVQT